MDKDVILFKELWFRRNPSHEINACSEEDMFWDTAELVAREYYEKLNTICKPKQPTHEEIMTKWWFIKKSLLWKRVETLNTMGEYFITGIGWLHRSWFMDEKSADLPPEA